MAPATESICMFVEPAVHLANVAASVGAVRLAEVQPIDVGWLWPGRIPLGRVSLLVSDPGNGKSLVALDIAARVTRGGPWPDKEGESGRRGEGETDPSSTSRISPSPTLPISPSSVLLLTAEDNLADTIRPRLEALGADCSRVLALSHVPAENDGDLPRPFACNRDLGRLTDLLAAMPDCRLVILDPISAFLGSTSDQSNADVWKLLSSLANLARERNLAILIVSHLRKKEGAAMYRTLGSLAFIAATRAAWIIVQDPAEPDRRLFLPLKNNLAPNVQGLAFTIESNQPNRPPSLRWLPDAVEFTADSLPAVVRPPGRPDEERQFAVRWLSEQLAQGPTPAREVREAAEFNGISYGTLRRAFRDIGAVAFQPRDFFRGPWMWKLPGSDAQNPGEEMCASDNSSNESLAAIDSWLARTYPGVYPSPS